VELSVAAGIVVLLVALAGYFAWRQRQTLRSLSAQTDLAPEDRVYVVAQCWRRLLGCVLMLAFSGMLAGWYVFGLNRAAEELRSQGQAAAAAEDGPRAFTPEQQRHYNLFSTYWIVASLLLMALVGLACTDIWAIRRYGMRHLRRLRSDRKEAIAKEIALYRSRRNGQGG
jgi:hypothetical protein